MIEAAPTDPVPERRLLVVSNREPYVAEGEGEARSWRRTTGGLVTALEPVVRRGAGSWVAWEPHSERRQVSRHRVPAESPRFTLLQVPLSDAEVEGFYEGFANRALWPLFHYFVDRCHFDEEQWRAYVRVNRRFADAVATAAGEVDLAWVHDYHFCLLPGLLREMGLGAPEVPLAFFLHIPFPAAELYQIFPWRRELLEGLLGADLVGFHTPSYATHFMDCCQRFAGAEVDFARGVVEWRGRSVHVGAFPIGIDVAEYRRFAADPSIVARSRSIRSGLGVERIVLGVDRLDYTKGIPARLLAIDRLFEHHPEWRRRLTFVQVAVRSRTEVEEYQQIKRRIDELVGRINGRYGDAQWQPIHYRNEALPRAALVAHYRAADVALVTPLRDGMNLVALEFCACRPDEDGVLVLSEFAGAAESIGRGAMVVNPFAVEQVAEAVHDALSMPGEERRRRMRRLHAAVLRHDQEQWMRSILAAVAEAAPAAR